MDCLTELGKETVTKLGELVVESTVKHFKYLTQHKKITTNLEEELEKLKMIKQALQTRVETERRKGYEIAPNVQKWLYDMTAIESELQKWLSDENKVTNKKKCFGGQCSNIAFNYTLGKQATKSLEYITSMKEEENKFQVISYPKAPSTLGSTFTKDIKSLLSREKIISEVIEKLQDDQVKMISICGMGGVGKTTMVKEVIKIIEKSKLFHEVVMAVVSQDINYEKIQIQIAEVLGMEMKKVSLQGRAMQLHERLMSKDKRVLIVLDDVWDILDFECIGLPYLEHEKYCKMLFTSRDEKVCQNMGCKVNFQVPVLSEDEAWYLFREMSGEVVDRNDINPIAREVAKECGGLPLAIATIGRALSNEGKSAWEDALRQLNDVQSSSSSDVGQLVYPRIELSLKFLGSKEHKLLLMLCGLFPEDFDIPIESLLYHAFGLGLFKYINASWKARNRVHTLVEDLRRKFLLLDSNVPGRVKMHDIVRNVVISKAFKNEEDKCMVQYTFKSLKEEKLNEIKAISLILDDTKELENGLHCPVLKLLQVSSKSKESMFWPELFFQGMSVLKVLSMKNLCIPKLPYLSQASLNLHTLQVEHCDVGDISIIGKELKQLEVLSFAHSNIKELPIEIGNMGSLRLLDLTECNELSKISKDVFIRLSRLEELYFRMDNFPWKKNEVALNELKKISHQLKVIEMKFRGTEILVKDLDFNNLQKFWVYVDPYSNFHRSSYLESTLLQVTGISYQSMNNILMISQLIKKCEILSIRKVKGLKNVMPQMSHECPIPYLKDLRVDSCPDMEYLIDYTVHCNDFPQIRSLYLRNLQKLKEICYTPNYHEVKGMIDFSYLVKLELINLPSFMGFNNAMDLKELNQELSDASDATEIIDSTSIVDGEKLTRFHSEPQNHRPLNVIAKLFSSNWMNQFSKLETILLEDCFSIEVVFDLEGYLKSNGQAIDLLFPKLTKIEISKLKNLSYVWGIVPHRVKGFQNLRFLTISNCDSLKHVFTSVIAREITNLEKLEVKWCALIENIVASSIDEEDENKGHVANIIFNKLDCLSLSKLPKLVSICSNSVWLECPSLMKFDIGDCPMLEMYFIPTNIDAKHDNLNTTNSTNTKDVGFQSFNQNNSRSSSWSSRCMPFIPKFIHQVNPSNKNRKEASVTQEIHDHIPSIFEINRKGKSHMPTLEDLCIVKCDLLDVLFFLEEKCNFTILSHMKTIKIEKCDKLKAIIATREKREDMINSFALLESLHLRNLPNLVRLCFLGAYESWDKQQFMDEFVGDLVSLRHHPLIDEALFPNLTSLLIEECKKINILFSHSIVSSLEHLQKLEVRRCENMEEIISNQEDIEATNDKIMYRALQHLLLKELPSLKAFFQGHYNLNFPSLKKVCIEDCPKLEVFSRGDSYTPMLEDLTIKSKSLSSNYIQKKDINSVIRGFKSFVASQGLEMLNWTKQHNKGYFIKNTKINIKEFHKLLVLVPEIHMLQDVRELTLSDCDSLVEMFETEGKSTQDGDDTIDYQLQKLTLKNLPKLSHIWKHNITKVVSFQNLKDIDVYGCHNLTSLLSISMAKSLVQLEKLKVFNCDLMEEIITKEEEYIEGRNKVKTLFPKLERLSLNYLPKLKCVCSGDYDYDIPLCTVEVDKEFNNIDKVQISFPQLKELWLSEVRELECFCSGAYDYNIMVSSIKECPNMTTFPHGNVIVDTPNLDHLWWDRKYIQTFGDLNLTIYYLQNSEKYKAELQKLETFRDMDEELLGYIKSAADLYIVNCHKLLNCIPSNMMQLFSHLRLLKVKECECLEEIFVSNDSLLEYRLSYLSLYSLPKLKHIWKSPGQILGFQNLTDIEIKQCNDLKYVFPDVSIATSLPKLWSISVCECKKIEEIIGNNYNHVEPQQQKANKIIFPRLCLIQLVKLPSLKWFSQSSFPCCVEMPQCEYITIEDCPKMKTFWDEGIIYTPRLYGFYAENTEFDKDEDVNEVIQRHNK